MKTFQIIIVDDTGSKTHTIVSFDMYDAMFRAMRNIKTIHLNSIVSVTATTL